MVFRGIVPTLLLLLPLGIFSVNPYATKRIFHKFSVSRDNKVFFLDRLSPRRVRLISYEDDDDDDDDEDDEDDVWLFVAERSVVLEASSIRSTARYCEI